MSGTNPYRSHRFVVEVDGLVSAGFAEVEGLAVTAGVFADPDDVPDEPPEDESGQPRPGGIFGALSDAAADFAEGLNWIDPDHWPGIVNWTEPGKSNPPPRQRRAEFPLLTLRRGVTDSPALETWVSKWIAGVDDQRSVRILLLDTDGREARGWKCRAAVPVRWSGPTLRADRTGVAMESIELAHAGITALDLDGDD